MVLGGPRPERLNMLRSVKIRCVQFLHPKITVLFPMFTCSIEKVEVDI